MYIDDLKKQSSFDSTYSKAVNLLRRGYVNADEPDYAPDGIVLLSGSVCSSDGSGSYYAGAELDIDAQRINTYYCSCPASESYAGMCKHATALVLSHLRNIGEVSIPVSSSRLSGYGYSSQSSRTAPRSCTSTPIEVFLTLSAQKAQAAIRKAASAEQGEAAENPAELVCVLAKGTPGSYYRSEENTWSLGLKVVRGKASYVVKDLGAVVSAWREGREYSYGKNLAFVHRRGTFTDRANKLLDLIGPLIDAQKSLRSSQLNRSRWSSEIPSYNAKFLPLTAAQTAEVLELMMGGAIIYEMEDYSSYNSRLMKRTVPVASGNPKLNVIIDRNKANDYELSVYPSEIECIEGANSLFFMTEDAALRASDEFAESMGALCRAILPCRNVLHIRQQDMPAFCAAALEALVEHTDLSAPGDLTAILPPKPEFTFIIGQQDGYITCAVQVRYGSASINLFDPVEEGQPSRDVALEMGAQQTVRTFFSKGDYTLPDYSYTLRSGYYDRYRSYSQPLRDASGRRIPPVPCFPEHDDAAYYLLFSEGLRELAQLGEVRMSERLANVRIRQAPSVGVRAQTNSGLLDIEVDSLDMTPQELLGYLSSYRRKQRYVRLSNGDIMRLDGSGLQALGDLADGLGVHDEDLVDGLHGLQASRTLFVDAMLKRAGGVRFERDEGFRRIVRNFETIADADFSEPKGLNGELRPYQTEGFKWLSTLGEAGFGGILADDMGLGKTLQAITYLLAQREAGERKPALVVCPASLLYNWISEIERFAPTLGAQAVAGTKKAREQAIAKAGESDVLVTSYDLMKRDADCWAAQHFSCLILDEAQYIKNSATKAAKCAKAIPADVRFALTGTPIENRLSELWSIFDFLMPGVLGTSESFGRRFASPIGSGDEGAAKRLQSLVGPFILRRLKSQVLTDLPDKNESVVYANMSGEQEKLYRSSEAKLALTLSKQLPEEFAHAKLEVLAELTKLRQICCDPNLLFENYAGDSAKLETCMEMVRNAVDGGHSILLFSQFTSMLEIIETQLNAEKIGHIKLTGATSKEERVRLVKRFQAHEVPVFLISLKAGGVGLNLTAADIVIHYDPWWNLAAQNQATDRAHRIGQEKEVSVFMLIAKNTIEERIVKMQEHKRDLAESVLGGEATANAAITQEDLLALLNAGR